MKESHVLSVLALLALLALLATGLANASAIKPDEQLVYFPSTARLSADSSK